MTNLNAFRYACSCLLMLCCTAKSFSANYYFSAVDGDDSRTSLQAQQATTPWRSIAKLNQFFSSLQAGDVIYFKRGEIFDGTIIVTKSGSAGNPIRLDAYGSGVLPVVSGFTSLQQWSPAGNGVYETTNAALGTSLNMLVINGRPFAKGRFPNASATNNGYLSFESSIANLSITDLQLPGSPNWTGGEVVIRKNRWVVDRNQILLHAGPLITYTSQSHYNADAYFGYFIQNHPQTLDLEGEWYYSALQRKVGLYTGNQQPNNVLASSRNNLVVISGQHDVHFSNINFRGANENAFQLMNVQAIHVDACEVLYSGINAFDANNSSDIHIQNSSIQFTNNDALDFNNCSGTIIRNNTIRSTGVFAGMGQGDAGSYEAILISGNNNVIELNRIDSTGYIPITFNGNNISIVNNLINHFAFVKDDGGGIYTYNGSGTAQVNSNRKIIGNIVLNGIGAGEGTTDLAGDHVNGIYLDDKSNNVLVENNTVAWCGRYGIYLHNANSITLRGNTLFDNRSQLGIIHDNNAVNNPVRNITADSNIYFSRLPASAVAEFKSIKNDLASFGVFNNNVYARPVDDLLTINTLRYENGSAINKSYDLNGWSVAFGKDAQSVNSPVKLPVYQLNQLLGENKMTNGAFNSNVAGVYVWSAAGNSRIAWNNGQLDQGTLGVTFTNLTGTVRRSLLVMKAGAVAAGKSYLLKFSLKGANDGKTVQAYLRKSLAGYNDLSARTNFKITLGRTENEIVFTAAATESNASIVFELEESSSPLYFDNVQLTEASISPIDVNTQVRFEYNASATPRSFSLLGNYVDSRNRQYQRTVTLEPFNSIVLMRQQGGAGADTAANFPACGSAGYLYNEHWDSIAGNSISSIPLETAPSSTNEINSLEIRNLGTNYGTRMRGLLCAPQTGIYKFFISGDDAAELYISTDSTASNKVRVANVPSWTALRQWDKFASQQSGAIALVKGQRYYIEVQHKQGGGGNHCSVAWQLPGGRLEAPIPGGYLSPINGAMMKQPQTIYFDSLTAIRLGSAPVQLSAEASSGLPVAFEIISGPANINGNILTAAGAGMIVIRAIQPGNAQYNAAAPVVRTLVVLRLEVPVVCAATGTVSIHQWLNVPGNSINDIPLGTMPSVNNEISSVEMLGIPVNSASMMEGYYCAPAGGDYIFYLSADDAAELWLSTDESPDNVVRIARVLSWTDPHQWNKYPSQASVSIGLSAGRRYYFRILHKQGAGGGHFSLGCTLPDGTNQLPVAPVNFSPFVYLSLSRL